MHRFFTLLRYDLPLHIVLISLNWLPDLVSIMRFRGFCASAFFGYCGRDFRLGRSVTFYNPSKIRIGSSVYIAYGNWLSAGADIVIEDEVLIGPKSIFASANHTKLEGSFRYGRPILKPITIKRGSWVAGNCSILAGSEIGEGSVIGASTVVRENVPPHVLFVGNPGKVIKNV